MNNIQNMLIYLSSRVVCLFALILCAIKGYSQQYSLANILDSIQTSNPAIKMYDADIQSMNAAAKGARAWMPPEVGAGFFMTPYNSRLWKNMNDMEPGMGSVMLSLQQMFPNRRKLNAEAAYMESMSGATQEQKKTWINEIYAQAKTAYYNWLIIEKKRNVLNENEKILDFMIKNAEIRYKNGLEKINAYYMSICTHSMYK